MTHVPTHRPPESCDVAAAGGALTRAPVRDDPAAREDLIGLARVSTDAQELARQIDALKTAGCARIYLDKASGVKGTTRPGLTAALDHMRRGGIVLDTSDDMCGELIFTVFAAIAKFQRQQIVKGTREGLDAARARGRVGGRPRALTSEQIADAGSLLGAGQTRTAVAAKLRVSRGTLSRALDTASR